MSTKKYYDKLQEFFKQKHDRFMSNLRFVEETQERNLLKIIKDNKKTMFGQEHHFDLINNIRQYQRRVPIRCYEDFNRYMLKILNGEKKVLTEEEIVCLHPTSGSTLPVKLIPFTKTLKKQFQSGIFTWLYDLFERKPEIKSGRFYWSITPLKKNKTFDLPIKMGFGDDFDYFESHHLDSLNKLSAVPLNIASSSTTRECQRKTLDYLVKTPDLSFIAVWNQKSFKQTRVIRYNNRIKYLRRIINATSSFTNLPRLPNEGEVIDNFYIGMPLSRDNNPEILEDLLSKCFIDNSKLGNMVVGFAELDCAKDSLIKFRKRVYLSNVYLVSINRLKIEELINRTPYLEVGAL